MAGLGMFPVMHWGTGVFIPHFTGSPASYMRRSTAFTNPGPGPTAILFVSFRTTSFSDVILEFQSIKLAFTTQSGIFRVDVEVGANGFNSKGFATSPVLDPGEWGTLIIEIDTDDWVPSSFDDTVKVFINDRADNYQTITGTAGEDVPFSASRPTIAASNDVSPADLWDGCIEKIWFHQGINADMDDSGNRRRFYNADLTPKDLGDNGEDPFSVTPIAYFKPTRGKFFNINAGSGGDMTIFNGPLEKCGGNPDDDPPDS